MYIYIHIVCVCVCMFQCVSLCVCGSVCVYAIHNATLTSPKLGCMLEHAITRVRTHQGASSARARKYVRRCNRQGELSLSLPPPLSLSLPLPAANLAAFLATRALASCCAYAASAPHAVTV